MGSGYTGTTPTAATTQTSVNRTVDELKDEIASFTGGQDRKKNLDKAEQALRESVRRFNAEKWTFNRVKEDITLVAAQADYDLSSDFRNALRAQMVDSSGKTRQDVTWVPWSSWVKDFPDQSTTGSMPIMYTARNIHITGQITVDPVPASSLTYPTLRLFYHKRIVFPATGSGTIDVPTEMEQAIFEDAVWMYLRKVKTFKDAREARVEALISKSNVMYEYVDFEDYYGA